MILGCLPQAACSQECPPGTWVVLSLCRWPAQSQPLSARPAPRAECSLALCLCAGCRARACGTAHSERGPWCASPRAPPACSRHAGQAQHIDRLHKEGIESHSKFYQEHLASLSGLLGMLGLKMGHGKGNGVEMALDSSPPAANSCTR